MKFLVTKDLAYSALLKNLIVGVCIALFFYFILDIVLHGYVIGFEFEDIIATLYGNTEEFIEPILIDSLLLQVHMDLFMSLLAVMTIASIYIRLFSTKKMTKWLVHSFFLLSLLSPIILMVAYLTSKIFVILWIGGFLAGHFLAMVMTVMIIKKLLLK